MIKQILENTNNKRFDELRITGVRGERQYIGQLLEALNDEKAPKVVRKLKLSVLPFKSDSILQRHLIKLPEANASLT